MAARGEDARLASRMDARFSFSYIYSGPSWSPCLTRAEGSCARACASDKSSGTRSVLMRPTMRDSCRTTNLRQSRRHPMHDHVKARRCKAQRVCEGELTLRLTHV